ncbi:hypothetical protein K3181_10750 [Qipengyuania sp. YG27]|uniref:Uncharacterized protein n=1 Tax=Qipengyuania mesophila TaxID=2867246 RepID=A0ABS7JW82_9SPHN|nr:hypothetical protein [Qipengyuania mesophila]MBX7501920.1 hypothetical protein [Qipengyuania mesophila]
MKRLVIVLALLAVAGALLWATVGGGLQGSVEERLQAELVARGLPQPMAECMAGRMAERLSVNQIRKLMKLAPEEGEADIPLNVAEFLERVRRVDDPEVLEVAAGSAAVCAFSQR